MYEIIIDLFIIYSVAMLTHEFGHYVALIGYGVSKDILEIRIMPFKPFIGVGYEGNYQALNNEQYITVLLAGIVSGLFGTWAAVYSVGFPDLAYLPIVAQYFFFCKSDIKNIWRTIK